MKKISGIVLIVLSICCLSRVHAKNIDDPITLFLGGCKTEYFLIKELSQAYSAKNKVEFRLLSIGNKRAISLFMSNRLDCTFTCKHFCKLKKKLKLGEEKTVNMVSKLIAKDPIVIVCNPDSGITNIEKFQLVDIFKGKINNWSMIGGKNLPVMLAYIDPAMESGMLPLFKEIIMGTNEGLCPSARKIGSPVGLGLFTAKNSGGITFLPFNASQGTKGCRILKIDGVAPDKESILNGKYKLSATYYLTYRKDTNGPVKDFIKFCLSDQGREIISRNFIPVF